MPALPNRRSGRRVAVGDGFLVLGPVHRKVDVRLQALLAAEPRKGRGMRVGMSMMHHDGDDLRPLPLVERRLRLTELLLRSDVHCLHLVQAFDDGVKLLEAAEEHGLEGIVSKRQASAYRSGPSRDWVKAKTAVWRIANWDRWKAFLQKR